MGGSYASDLKRLSIRPGTYMYINLNIFVLRSNKFRIYFIDNVRTLYLTLNLKTILLSCSSSPGVQ